jgi:hypothetical protein
VNYQDGGVDTQVSTALSVDRRGYFGAQTVWQYKAVADNTSTKAKLQDEVKGKSKEYLRKLLKAGYAYRICVAANLEITTRKGNAQHAYRLGLLFPIGAWNRAKAEKKRMGAM